MHKTKKGQLIKVLKSLKQGILDVERKSTKLSEQDTRQGLINTLFKALGWDFSDFESIKSEHRHSDYNEPVDYAFFHQNDKNKPVLLVEAKSFGTDLNNGKIIKQLCAYLGQRGVQWGVLTDGDKYVMYNSNSDLSFKEQRFLTLQIKTADTEDGIPFDELAEKFLALLSRGCLENDKIQLAYESLTVNKYIKEALDSLLMAPFETLAGAIKREFKEKRISIDSNLKISKKQIISYFESLQDEDGRISIEGAAESSASESSMLQEIAQSQEQNANHDSDISLSPCEKRIKRITISDLLKDKMVDVGDSWRFEYKGEFTWGRVTSNGEIEVNGKTYTSPSKAGWDIIQKSCNGWYLWSFKDSSQKWHPIKVLRDQYRERYGFAAKIRIRRAS